MSSGRPGWPDVATHLVIFLMLSAGLSIGGPPAGAQTTTDPVCASEPPLDIVLVLDRSGSMDGTPIETAKMGAQQLVGTLTPDDHSALVSYASTARLDKPLDADHSATDSAIEALDADGSTATGDGIDAAHDELGANGRSDARQVMVVLSDGHTNTGSDPVTQADEAKADGIEIYGIALGDGADATEMKAVASDPDETYFHHPADADELAQVFAELTSNLVRRQEVAEAFAVRADLRDPDGSLASLHKAEQQRYPPGGTGAGANRSVTTGTFDVSFDVLTAEATGHHDDNASTSAARASIANLSVVDTATGRLLLSADTISSASTSQATPDAAASSADGTRIAGLFVQGHGTLEQAVPPNTHLAIPDVGEVVLNGQVSNSGPNHSDLLVTGVNLTVSPLGADGAFQIVVGSAYSAASCTTDTRYPVPAETRGEPLEENASPEPPGEEDLPDPPGTDVLEVQRDSSEGSSGGETWSQDTTTVLVYPADATIELARYSSEKRSASSGWESYDQEDEITLTVCVSDVCRTGHVLAENDTDTYSSSTREEDHASRELEAGIWSSGVGAAAHEDSTTLEDSATSSLCATGDTWAFNRFIQVEGDVCDHRYTSGDYERHEQSVWTYHDLGLDVYGDSYTRAGTVDDHDGDRYPLFEHEGYLIQETPFGPDVGLDADYDVWGSGDPDDPRLEMDVDVDLDLPTGWTEVDFDLDLRDGILTVTVSVDTPETGVVSHTVTLPP